MYHLDRERFIQAVKTVMSEQNMNSTTIGELLDVNPGQVRHWLNPNDEQNPGMQNCYLLAGHLGIDLLAYIDVRD